MTVLLSKNSCYIIFKHPFKAFVIWRPWENGKWEEHQRHYIQYPQLSYDARMPATVKHLLIHDAERFRS